MATIKIKQEDGSWGYINGGNPQTPTINVDTTLSVSGAAADAKTVGTKLGDKVDKVTGKGLSTNDYTTSEKNKLSGIEEGANKTIVDTSISGSSTNAVSNKAVYDYVESKVTSGSGASVDLTAYKPRNLIVNGYFADPVDTWKWIDTNGGICPQDIELIDLWTNESTQANIVYSYGDEGLKIPRYGVIEHCMDRNWEKNTNYTICLTLAGGTKYAFPFTSPNSYHHQSESGDLITSFTFTNGKIELWLYDGGIYIDISNTSSRSTTYIEIVNIACYEGTYTTSNFPDYVYDWYNEQQKCQKFTRYVRGDPVLLGYISNSQNTKIRCQSPDVSSMAGGYAQPYIYGNQIDVYYNGTAYRATIQEIYNDDRNITMIVSWNGSVPRTYAPVAIYLPDGYMLYYY